jgi:hypothetical protein
MNIIHMDLEARGGVPVPAAKSRDFERENEEEKHEKAAQE